MADMPEGEEQPVGEAQPTEAKVGYWVSPHFPDNAFHPPLTDEQKVELFADNVRGWQLDVAERLIASDPHSGLAVLSIVLSYFEMMGKYRDGYEDVGKSKHYFHEGFRWFARSTLGGEVRKLEERLSTIYDQLRCGMYHDATIGPGVVLSGEIGANVFGLRGDEVHVNPRVLVRALQMHFSRYVADLLGDASSELRRNFVRRFDWRQQVGGAVTEAKPT